MRSHDLNRLLDELGLERWRAPRKYLFGFFRDICFRNNKLRHFCVACNFYRAQINFVKPLGDNFAQALFFGAEIPSSAQSSRWNAGSVADGRKGHREKELATTVALNRGSDVWSANPPRSGFVQPRSQAGRRAEARRPLLLTLGVSS